MKIVIVNFSQDLDFVKIGEILKLNKMPSSLDKEQILAFRDDENEDKCYGYEIARVLSCKTLIPNTYQETNADIVVNSDIYDKTPIQFKGIVSDKIKIMDSTALIVKIYNSFKQSVSSKTSEEKEDTIKKLLRLEKIVQKHKNDLDIAQELISQFKEELWNKFNLTKKEEYLNRFYNGKSNNILMMFRYLFENLDTEIKNEEIFNELIDEINKKYSLKKRFDLQYSKIYSIEQMALETGYVFQQYIESENGCEIRNAYFSGTIDSFAEFVALVNKYKEKDKQNRVNKE